MRRKRDEIPTGGTTSVAKGLKVGSKIPSEVVSGEPGAVMAGTKSLLEAEPVSVGDSTHLNTQVLKDPVKPADSGIDSRPSSTSAKPPVKRPNYSEWPLDWKASAASKKIINDRDKSLNPDMSLPKAVKPTPKSYVLSLLERSPRFKAWRKMIKFKQLECFLFPLEWVWLNTIDKHD
ncbi:hypothetical protein PGTUg99_005062 [Puccinia graminis f. sp. tritici]|uniref:Uncharacterized protein n=1 Tax=Puccinia graminis f. sp. tritici TaxID=56615 RepID=A0A5B0QDY1_PUCGR|nr:hypothetical protein PGTUg99_005062 [Puccinia graminis f. sp. tritici]